MKFSVLALDYDGTVARNDVLDPSVRKAIADVRAQGIVVVLVTGRILDDLRRVAGDLHCQPRQIDLTDGTIDGFQRTTTQRRRVATRDVWGRLRLRYDRLPGGLALSFGTILTTMM